jgi:flagellar motor switch protein FliG
MAAEGTPGNMSGTQRAAILLMSLGENEAAQVLKHMGAKDVQKLGQAMATMSNVTREMAASVMDKFITTIE